MGGKLQYFAHEWYAITRDPVILDIENHCHLDINVNDVTYLFHGHLEYRFSYTEQGIINGEIAKLLRLGVIKVTTRQDEQIISPVFLRKKRNREHMMVLNLENLNAYNPYKHFKIDNFEQAIRLVKAGDYLASVDLRHAYYSIRIVDEQQKFICFSWQGRTYKFTWKGRYSSLSS